MHFNRFGFWWHTRNGRVRKLTGLFALHAFCPNGNRRGQMSLEMIVSVGFVLLALVAFSSLAYSRYGQFLSERDMVDAKAIARQASVEINVAIIAGPGYSRQFELPMSLSGGGDYTVRTVPLEQSVAVSWEDGYYSIPLLSADVEEKQLAHGTNTISNQGGVIHIA